jgi:cytochrome c biogenesis protein CcdA
VINEWLEFLSNIILQKAWLAPFLAIFAGLLTSITPCSLSSVPLVIGCVGGSGANDTKKAFKLSVTFALGIV